MSSLLVLPAPGAAASGDTLVIDPGVLPGELERILRAAQAAGGGATRVTHLVLTHAHWDHLSGVLFFEDRCPGLEVIASARFPQSLPAPDRDPGGPEADVLRALSRRPLRPARPIGVETLLAGLARPAIAFPAPGHTSDSLALLLPEDGVLVPGDSLSAIEIPYLDDSIQTARSTLALFETILREGRAEIVVPGHGPPLPAARALEILEQDAAYLAALSRGAESGDRESLERMKLPRAGTDPEVRRGHALNVRLALDRAGLGDGSD